MYRMFSRYHDMHLFLEGIIAVHFHSDGCPSYQSRDNAWSIADSGQTRIERTRPEMASKFGPALVHIGGTAAKVWFQSKDVGLRPIGGVDGVLGDGTNDLVDLLVVLVSPHIRLEGSGECIESDALQAISLYWSAKDGDEDF